MLEKGVSVPLELNMQNKFFPENKSSFNIIAEIPGTDPALKDEVVMIGAHFDSWHSGTGATDNGAGSGVMLESMRLLKTLNLKPRAGPFASASGPAKSRGSWARAPT